MHLNSLRSSQKQDTTTLTVKSNAMGGMANHKLPVYQGQGNFEDFPPPNYLLPGRRFRKTPWRKKLCKEIGLRGGSPAPCKRAYASGYATYPDARRVFNQSWGIDSFGHSDLRFSEVHGNLRFAREWVSVRMRALCYQ